MRKSVIITVYMVAVSLCLSCNNGKGKKFNPQGREQVFASDNERQRAIEKKKATYYGIAMSVKRICEAIMRDEKSILPIFRSNNRLQ